MCSSDLPNPKPQTPNPKPQTPNPIFKLHGQPYFKMHHFYKMFLQAMKMRRLNYRMHMDKLVKDCPVGVGNGRDHRINLYFNSAFTKKRIFRKSGPGIAELKYRRYEDN